jgi:predicted nucleotidyltransferase component of viral defense system
MLHPDELAEVAEAFGVSDDQVRLDHLISHVIAALADLELPMVFFGGTALARTHLIDPAAGSRLSEDLDLYSAERRAVADELDRRLPAMIRREFPRSTWQLRMTEVRTVEPGILVTEDGLSVRIQLLDSAGDHADFAKWPTERRPVALRYGDTPGEVMMRIPTLSTFAAMKTCAWMDRRTPRDLYDLARLADRGALTAEAGELVRSVTGWRVTRDAFARLPDFDWTGQLAHQARDLPSAAWCLETVRSAYASSLGWDAA